MSATPGLAITHFSSIRTYQCQPLPIPYHYIHGTPNRWTTLHCLPHRHRTLPSTTCGCCLMNSSDQFLLIIHASLCFFSLMNLRICSGNVQSRSLSSLSEVALTLSLRIRKLLSTFSRLLSHLQYSAAYSLSLLIHNYHSHILATSSAIPAFHSSYSTNLSIFPVNFLISECSRATKHPSPPFTHKETSQSALCSSLATLLTSLQLPGSAFHEFQTSGSPFQNLYIFSLSFTFFIRPVHILSPQQQFCSNTFH
jgi:hypothetical protein